MKKNLNEEVIRIKQMMNSIIKENFDISDPESNERKIIDCDYEILDSDVIEIVVMYDMNDEYETYKVFVDFEYEEMESATYDYPGSGGGMSGTVTGIDMTFPQERELTPEEATELLNDNEVTKCVSRAITVMEEDNNGEDNSDYDPDDDYERRRED